MHHERSERATPLAAPRLGFINLPVLGVEPKRQICATNVAFGDEDRRSLFITACDQVYKVRLLVPGVTSGPAPEPW